MDFYSLNTENNYWYILLRRLEDLLVATVGKTMPLNTGRGVKFDIVKFLEI